MDKIKKLQEICKLVRYCILTSTTAAGSGHPSSSLSAVELMTGLFFGEITQESDRVIFSKGHAAPLLYSLYHAAGLISFDELLTLRTFNSNLEGHPTPRFPYVEVATGSLGQGLSIGLGIALGMKLKYKTTLWPTGDKKEGLTAAGTQKALADKNCEKILPHIWVLIGDSEMAEGQVWEAIELAGYYKLDNLVAIVDVNRLGQRGETMLGWNIKAYKNRVESFGWNAIVVDDGHDLKKILNAYQSLATNNQPLMIIAKTIKGKGVSFLENQEGWHGKPLNKKQLNQALTELGEVNFDLKEKTVFSDHVIQDLKNTISQITYQNLKSTLLNFKAPYSTREAYGDALSELGNNNKKIVVFDAETSNSTYSSKFAEKYPERFFEMFIAEQNMISTALGISKQGFIPFVSTFAAFLTRGFDQIRMSQYSNPNLKICGSHAGCSIGTDGASQMGLEDISMFRSILDSVVFYPSDAVSCFKLTEIASRNPGLFYLRTTREKLSLIYHKDEEFKIGGSKILKSSKNPKALVIAAGITVHEALKAYEKLVKEGIGITVIDLYSVKPIDLQTIKSLITDRQSPITNVVVVEDHYPSGGLGEAISSTITDHQLQITNFTHLCVKKIPRSGTMEELLAYEEIDADAIYKAVKSLL